jgi:predicted TIM-barrel fold metal-dependent hydrolase
MQKVSECPNVALKISGISIPKSSWNIETNRWIVETLIELFGIARCMFASNFPVDKVCASFDEIYGGFEKIVANFAEQEKDMLFRSNANRIYAMGLE